jgi:hypothetical protein
MRTFLYTALAVILTIVLALNPMKVFNLGDAGLFIIIIALIYGLVSAFTISQAWERFTKIRDAVTQEMNSLVTMHIYAKQMSDTASVKQLQDGVIGYCDMVPQVDWHQYWKAEETHKRFRSLFEVLAKMKLKNAKDVELFNEVSHELRSASHARDTQMLMAQTRISSAQWGFNLFLSGVLIMTMVLLAMPSYWVSVVLVAIVIVSVITILFLIHELDSMSFAEREIACEPYANVMRIVSEGAIDPDQELWYQDKSAIKPPTLPHPAK